MEQKNREGEVERRPERVDSSFPFRFDIPWILLRIRQIFRRPAVQTLSGLVGLGILMVAVVGASPGETLDAPTPLDESLLADASEALEARHFPVEINDRVRHWMERFTGARRPDFELFLEREGLFGDIIRDRLQRRGLPEELLYFAMVESAFSTRAVSSAEAVGVWQFTDVTARSLGLRVDEWVDERRDPIRATDAALTYLERLHDRFGTWYLAAAAYNAGPTRVARLVRGTDPGEDGVVRYWELSDQLPVETREYVPKVLAVALLSQQVESHGFSAVRRDRPYEFERVWVPGGTSLERVSRSMAMPLHRLRELNPHLLQGVTPPGATYAIRVPPGRGHEVVAALGPWVGAAGRTALADD